MSTVEETTVEQESPLANVLPILPLRDTVVFPDSMTPLAIGQERSVRLIDDVVAGDRLLALVTTRDSAIETPGWNDIYEIAQGSRTNRGAHKLRRALSRQTLL